MDESKPDRSSSDKQETEEILVHNEKHPTHNRETHGLRDDIDATTPIGDVKGPNVFERVKEEFEAIVEAIHQRKEDSPSSVGRDNATPSGSKHEKQISLSDKQETEEILVHNEKHPTHNRETHGLRDDIDANTPIGDVKGPNVFERVKEEFEAIVEAIHQCKEDKNQDSPSSVGRDNATPSGSKHEKQSSLSEERMGSPIKCKVENSDIKSETHKDKSPVIHHKETHGRGDDIDADIPISEFKGPSIFHRAKEEIEALVDTIHTKKDSDNDAESPKKEGGFRASISKKLHRIRNRD